MLARHTARRLRCTCLVLSALTLACRDREQAAVQAEGKRVTESDAQLVSYVNWLHDWIVLGNRHKAALDAEMPSIEAKVSVDRSYRVAQDPDLLALLERQRAEMRVVMSRAPQGMEAEALGATLQGLGQMVIGADSIRWVPGRNEAALNAARARFGETFVSWVLAHESMILAELATKR